MGKLVKTIPGADLVAKINSALEEATKEAIEFAESATLPKNLRRKLQAEMKSGLRRKLQAAMKGQSGAWDKALFDIAKETIDEEGDD